MDDAMRLAVRPRSGRLFGRLPRPTVYSAAELILLALIAVQAARLAWVLVTPVGPVGDWRPSSALVAPADGSTLAAFDPFFRLSGAAGLTIVTGLNLKLYGVREDRATGRGSAIIALPDGVQSSYAVGDEVMPGVILAAVGFDNVTISRGGALEQIFLDQSTAAPAAPGAPVQAVAAPIAPSSSQPLVLQPRGSGGQVTGLIVSPGNDGGEAFRAAGFQPGDVIVSINGQRVTSADQARALIGQAGAGAVVMVDRWGSAVPLRVRFNP
jgi:general secretion pathway protein C